MSPPLVSVVIPVYNGERFLAEALESAFAQDHRPLEVIVIDDGSTDRSAEVAGSFEDVVLLRLSENVGPAAARNAGLGVARGSFVVFLDADDAMTPGIVSTELAYLRAHSGVDGVGTRQELLVEPGLTAPEWWLIRDRLTGDLGGAGSLYLISRTAADRVGGFDPSYRVCEDMDWLFRLNEAGVVVDFLPAVGVIRRVHENNLTHQVEAGRLALARAVRARLERARAREAGARA